MLKFQINKRWALNLNYRGLTSFISSRAAVLERVEYFAAPTPIIEVSGLGLVSASSVRTSEITH